MRTKGKGLCLSLLGLLLAVCLLGGCGEKGESAWQEQYDLGLRYLDEGNYEQAILAFTAAIEIDPMRAEAYVGRGQAYVGSGETEENLTAARSDFKAALDLDGTLASAWLGLADVYLREDDPDRARDVLEEARDKTGENQDVLDKLEELEELLREEETPDPDSNPEPNPEPGSPDGSQPGGTDPQGGAVSAREQFDRFLADGGYVPYLEGWLYGQPQEYALLDISGDGREELIISGGDGMGFYGLAVFRLDPATGRIAPALINSSAGEGESPVGQYYSMLYYSPQYHALVYSELRTAYMYGSFGYRTLEGDRVDSAFSLGYEVTSDGTSEVTSYSLYRDGALESLTQEQYQAYQDQWAAVDFQPLPAL